MFEPQNRSLLTEQLQPLRGYELVQAVGTTFTLDLATALTIPLSFASRNLADHEDLGIIAALAQHTDRISVFTQAGGISVGVRSDLVALLEDVVQPVHPPHGIFHPKVWFLEYVSGDKRAFRFLCNSRNLTEDQSWDLSIRLDGELATGQHLDRVREVNEPLVSFLERLPELTVRPLAKQRQQSIAMLTNNISSVHWELPQGVSELKFHFLDGRSRSSSSQEMAPSESVHALFQQPAREALIVSPFISPEGLAAVGKCAARKPMLVSRAESLDHLPAATVKTLAETYVLDDLLALEHDEQLAPHDDQPAGALSGLHAKAVFLSERRYRSRARALIGSANITAGGLVNNIEMMVELHGHVNDLGPKGVLEALGPMLERYAPSGENEESAVEQARRSLESRVRSLAAGNFHARVTKSGGNEYSMSVWYKERADGSLQRMRNEGIEIRWRPISKTGEGGLLHVAETDAVDLSGLRLTEVTPFFRVTVTQNVLGEQITVSTIILAELHDDIPGRRDAVLAHGISNGDQFLKLLALLLDPEGIEFGLNGAGGGTGAGWSTTAMSRGLFESLLRSLARGDDGLEIANRILNQLRTQTDAELALPEGFQELWDNVWKARRRKTKGATR